MRSSLRRFRRLRELAQLARFIGRAPDTHAFQQLDVAQASLVASWRGLLQSGQILPFDAVGFQAYSENEEDGILLYIFTVAGTTNKTVVEISSQDGRTCMASNLMIHHRWSVPGRRSALPWRATSQDSAGCANPGSRRAASCA